MAYRITTHDEKQARSSVDLIEYGISPKMFMRLEQEFRKQGPTWKDAGNPEGHTRVNLQGRM